MQPLRAQILYTFTTGFMLIPLAGCPIDALPGPCAERDPGGTVTYAETVISGDDSQVVFVRSAYALCAEPRGTLDSTFPVEQTWVRVHLPDLTASVISPTPPAHAYLIASDGHWAVFVGASTFEAVLQDLDAGTRRTIPTEIAGSYPQIESIARPYLILQSSSGEILWNADSGETRPIGNNLSVDAILMSASVVYTESAALGSDIKLMDANTGDVRMLVQGESLTGRLYAAAGHVLWIGAFNSVHNYDLASGAASSLTQLGFGFVDPGAPYLVDVGAPGVLLVRNHNPFNLGAGVTLELLGYDGQISTIDDFMPVPLGSDTLRNVIYTPTDGRFAGSNIVYHNGTSWVIFNTADGTSQSIDPFAGVPPASQPAS